MCDQAVTEGQDVVISAKVSGQPTPMVHWWVLRSSPSRHRGAVTSVQSHCWFYNFMHHDNFFLLTQVKGQSPGEDGGAVRCTADG